jgi:hypothetical protein
MTPNLISVDLALSDLEAGAPVMVLDPDDLDLAGNVLAKFRKVAKAAHSTVSRSSPRAGAARRPEHISLACPRNSGTMTSVDSRQHRLHMRGRATMMSSTHGRMAAILSAVILGSIILGLVGCASGPKIVSSWRDPSYQGPMFKKIGVVGIAANDTNRRIFESVFVEQLRSTGLEAVASYEVNPTDQKLPPEEIETYCRENKIDAIITTRVVDISTEVQSTGPTVVAAPYPAYYGSYYGYYSTSWAYYQSPGYVYTYEVVRIETNVYETKNWSLVWTGTSETVDPSDIAGQSQTLSRALIQQLQIKGLVAP